jgi:uncharacterized MnhB-related membrane protein
MVIDLILSLIIAFSTFFLFAGETTVFERIVYSAIIFFCVFGFLEVFRYSWKWFKGIFKK